MTAPAPWHIGLDAGGSKTELLATSASSEGGSPLQLKGSAANMQRVGTTGTAQVLADVVRQFLDQASHRKVAAICAGVAGAGRPKEQQELTGHLRAALETDAPAEIRVVHDGELALEAAFEGKSGVIVIAGTGSLVLARTRDGRLFRAGGLGYLIGDEGSGFVLGRRGLRAVAAAYDGGPSTQLQHMLAERYDLHSNADLIQAVYQNNWDIPQMAPLVVEAAEEGDDVAQSLVKRATQELADQVTYLVSRGNDIEPQLALLGGLTKEDGYRSPLIETFREVLPGWQMRKPAHPPVMGALRLAQKLTGALAE